MNKNKVKVAEKIKYQMTQEIFDGFVDEIFERQATDYYRGRLIARFLLLGEQYES